MCGYVYFKEMLDYSEQQNMRTNPGSGFPWGEWGDRTGKEKGTVGESERTTGHRLTHTRGHGGMHKRDICQS